MSETAKNKLKSYLKPVETMPAPPISETHQPMAGDEPAPMPDAAVAPVIEDAEVHHLREVSFPYQDDEPDDPAPPMIVWETLIDRLEALSTPSPLDESFDTRIRQLYTLQEKLTSTVKLLSEQIDVGVKPDRDQVLIEQVTASFEHVYESFAEQQREMMQTVAENQASMANVMTLLIEKVNSISTTQPVINVPAPIVNVQVKEGGIITKTIERDERGLISKVTEGRT